MREETLYLYEMPPDSFEPYMNDPGVASFISTESVVPLSKTTVDDLIGALISRDVEFRVTPALWPLHDRVVASTIQYSSFRLRNAIPRERS
jgi:hypothetical protein